ncbi:MULTISPECIES: 50S ribosomal protein L17 [Fructilactobacillus]|uniref:Large ribosomal subunit protein bL17 n=2 Tax=Fructilactobacillus TaxID=2767881 RepID=A0A9Q8ZTY1_9LACO|nr:MULTISPECIES: 50S ribosomal protein L17 [Fructilactobacillus]USS86287.1 50S ribosomal protein L17 [Fructilactobacillus cliffordii]USS89355.1 50S ribosomal protein L17 [Fructilactobacillus cliffordii]USS90787.1 50S ribosomal protein L17 [Fructilactobacillus carniphilus]
MSYRKFGRESGPRRAMLRNLTTDLIVNDRIETTEAKAKTVRSLAEQMVTLGKKGDLAARRRAAAYLQNQIADVQEDGDDIKVTTALQKLFDEIAPKYQDRQGGYTRILKTMPRRGDGAQMVILEFV